MLNTVNVNFQECKLECDKKLCTNPRVVNKNEMSFDVSTTFDFRLSNSTDYFWKDLESIFLLQYPGYSTVSSSTGIRSDE